MASRKLGNLVEIWNRKLHFYLGLYLLLFLWTFSLSGLLLNHQWTFASFWPQRRQSSWERPIQPPPEGSDAARAGNLMQQLGLAGEMEWTVAQQAPGRFDFRVARPGRVIEVKADLATRRATLHQIQVNAWGVLHVLHTFSGVRMNDPRQKRDWLLTRAWSLSMDAVAIGLIFMVLSSYYMWYRLVEKRRWGMISLALGMASCGFFVFGLRWL